MKEDLLDIKRKLDRKKEIEEWIDINEHNGDVGMDGLIYLEGMPIAVRLCDVVEFLSNDIYRCHSIIGNYIDCFVNNIPENTYVIECMNAPLLHTLKVKG